MPVCETPQPEKERVGDRLPAPGQSASRRASSAEAMQRCLDLAVTGNLAANRTIRRFAATVDRVAPLDTVGPARQLELIAGAVEMSRRLAHAPFDLGRTLVNSAVLVDVDVDVDIGSQQPPAKEADLEATMTRGRAQGGANGGE